MSYQKSRNKRQDICQHAQLTSVLKIKCAYSKKKTVDNQKGTQGLLPKAFKQNNNTMYIHT